MRLLNVDTYQIEEFFDEDTPEYAILSHTWGDNEITFSSCQSPSGLVYTGPCIKIDGCCAKAKVMGLKYVWIDTICIDKSSSAELSEAINSMYRWYSDAEICLVYLADVPKAPELLLVEKDSLFRRSRWFTRGWTLQELLAPSLLAFFSYSWEPLCWRNETPPKLLFTEFPTLVCQGLISDITKIDREHLRGLSFELRTASIAERMGWAAGRQTKRREDRAYSLLGLFGVNMPMLYGEGDRAFRRLLKEIISTSDDETIFAGGFQLPVLYGTEILALSPDAFSAAASIRASKASSTSHYFSPTKV